jgi:hypothetical protein
MKQTDIFTLDNVIKIYVPGTIDEATPAPELQKVWTNKTAAFMSSLFGGATFGRFVGSWINDAGKLIEEPPNVVYSFTDSETAAAKIDAVVNFARELCRAMKQTAISVEYNGRLGFVGQNK